VEEDIVLDVDLPPDFEGALGAIQPVGFYIIDTPELLELAGVGGAVAAVAARALSVFQGAKGFWITTRSGARVFISEEAAARSASSARVTANGGVSESERRMVAAAFNKLPEGVRKEISAIEVFEKSPNQPMIGGRKLNVLGQWDEQNKTLHVFMAGVRKNPAALDHVLAHESGHAVYDRNLYPISAGSSGATPALASAHRRFTAASVKEGGITDYAQSHLTNAETVARTGQPAHAYKELYNNENFAEFHALYRQAKQDASGANKLVWDLQTGTHPESTAAFLDIAQQLGIS